MFAKTIIVFGKICGLLLSYHVTLSTAVFGLQFRTFNIKAERIIDFKGDDIILVDHNCRIGSADHDDHSS